MGRDAEDEDPISERIKENLVWQAKAGKQDAGGETPRLACDEGEGAVMEKERSNNQISQSDQQQQQLLLTSLLSQLVQGMQGSEKAQMEGMAGNRIGNMLGRESHKKEEGAPDGQQRVDKMVEQGAGLDLKKQGGKSGWQHGYEENKRNFDRYNKQVCGKCKDPRHTTKYCRVGHCLICGRENHITC